MRLQLQSGQFGVDPTAADEAKPRPTGVPERTAKPVRWTGDDRPEGARAWVGKLVVAPALAPVQAR